jgi:transcriptional regulator with XRE-family HTH domain
MAMAVELNSQQNAEFLKARQGLRLTQLELSEKAKISLRTIKDIESGRRTSYNEDTIIRLCRVLNLDFRALEGGNASPDAAEPRSAKKLPFRTVGGLLVIVLAGLTFFWLKIINKPAQRIDWVFEAPLIVHHFNPQWPNENAINVNYYHLNQNPTAGDTLPVELKWSYHFVPNSRPVYYVNAFSNWNPDRPIPIFDGVLSGDGSRIDSFEIVTPQKAGVYKARVFFAPAYGAVSSYYGHPPQNQLSTPSSAPHIEIPIEVLPK